MSNESGRGVVLMYHSITRSVLNAQYLRVAPETFNTQIQAVTERFEAVSLAELMARIFSRASGPFVAFSFDDGYADNLGLALPILRRFAIPATIFVATGPVLSGERFWWEELERILLLAPCRSGQLSIEVSGQRAVFTVEAEPSPSLDAANPNWRVSAEPLHWRHSLLVDLLSLMRRATETERILALEQLRELFDTSLSLPEVGRPLDPESLAELASDELIEIGGHTVTHPVLALLSPGEQDTEVRESKATLELLTGEPVRTFAYPFGRPADYTHETRRIVREAGYTYACSTGYGAVTASAHPFDIPRIAVDEEDSDVLLERIAGVLSGGS